MLDVVCLQLWENNPRKWQTYFHEILKILNPICINICLNWNSSKVHKKSKHQNFKNQNTHRSETSRQITTWRILLEINPLVISQLHFCLCQQSTWILISSQQLIVKPNYPSQTTFTPVLCEWNSDFNLKIR